MMPEHAAWRAMRAAARDPSVTGASLKPGTTRRALALAGRYRGKLTMFLILVLANALAGAATPLLYRAVIDDGIGSSPPRSAHPGVIMVLAIALAALAVIGAGLALAQRYISARVGEGIIYDLRTKVFAHVQAMPLAFFTQSKTGALVSRLDNDVLGAQQAFTSVLSNVVGSGLTVVITLAAMLFLSWEITLLCLLLLPQLLFSSRLVGHRLQRITRESYNLNAAMTIMTTERFDAAGALLAKLFGRPSEEAATFEQRAGRVRDIGVTSALYSQGFLVSLTLVASLAAALVYGLGGHMAALGILSVGTMVALASYLNRLFAPLTALSNAPVTVMSALVSFERVFEVLDLPPQAVDRPGARPLPRGPSAGALSVEFEHVSFAYPSPSEVSLASLTPGSTLESGPRREVLHDVSFIVEPGQTVALVGPSGAGKTTISHLVPRLYDVDGGAVRVGGTDVRDITLESLRSAVGMVTQDPHLFHDTIRANLLYARPEASDEEIWSVLGAAQLGEMAANLPEGLDTVVGDRGYRLSGGEKQRVAIARVLLKAPAVVLLDEATSHLDSESEQAVQRALSSVLVGRTALVIAHRLSTVLAADEILVVSGGRIVERGRHDELVALDGLYAELYRTQLLGEGPEAPLVPPSG